MSRPCAVCGSPRIYGHVHTHMPPSDPLPVEGAVLPERMKVVPLLAGDVTGDKWSAAEEIVFHKRSTYPPDSLSATYRDIAINMQVELAEAIARHEAYRTTILEGLDKAIAQRDAAVENANQWRSKCEDVEAQRDAARTDLGAVALALGMHEESSRTTIIQGAMDCMESWAKDIQAKDKAEAALATERARILQEAAEAILECQRKKAALPASSGDRAYAKAVKHSHEAVVALIQK